MAGFVDGTDGAGSDWVAEPSAPDDVLRFWKEGEAFPRLVISPATGEIFTGNGTVYPTDPLTGGGGGSAITTSFTPAGNIAAVNVQAAIEELDTEKAASSHAHAGEDITSGTVAFARLPTGGGATQVAVGNHDHTGVYQPLDADLTAIAALATAAYGRSVLTSADAAALRTLAGTVIGTDVQAYDAELAAIAGLTPTNGLAIIGNGSTFVMGSPPDPPTVLILSRQILK